MGWGPKGMGDAQWAKKRLGACREERKKGGIVLFRGREKRRAFNSTFGAEQGHLPPLNSFPLPLSINKVKKRLRWPRQILEQCNLLHGQMKGEERERET